MTQRNTVAPAAEMAAGRDAQRPCCGTPYEAIEPWDCPATPLFADTVRAVRPQDMGVILAGLRTLPWYVIARPDVTMRLDPVTASWEIRTRCCVFGQ